MNSKLTNLVNVTGNVSQFVIAGSILAELFYKVRSRKKTVAESNPDDDGDLSPSSPQTPLAA